MAKNVVDTAAAPYSESDEHVPDVTAVFGTLDTSGTAGGNHERLEMVTPVFDAARAQDLARAARAVDPDDTEVPESEVNLSTGVTTVAGDPEADRQRVTRAAKAYEKEPVPVADPSLLAAQKDADQAESLSGDERAAQVDAQQRGTSPAGGTKTEATGAGTDKGSKADAAKAEAAK